MKPTSHPFYEDLLALISGGLFVAMGIGLFNQHGLLTGGTAGMALVVANLTNISFGTLFFFINIPFYYLAWTQVGKRFTINTFVSVSLVSLLTEHMHNVISIDSVNPIFSAFVGGMMIGVGLLIMFRHSSSLGGLGILAFYLQQKFNIRAGTFQLVVDISIMAFAAFFFSAWLLALSVLGAVMMNIVLTVNHKPGRYQTISATPKQSIEQEALQGAHEALTK
ncbi:YitT family protein [Aestuariibacter sp. AA17]|uniref:YitT family protein n=1 Tax=Fluctibacter corallii TaxID=2984329 RepID=A0ABT3A500_9ALTE|nr:YitT family protein [Aestuariibacter sp. AA17]MCV2883667.1 YitT family protein [Aestuariibacter sp. AA17]